MSPGTEPRDDPAATTGTVLGAEPSDVSHDDPDDTSDAPAPAAPALAGHRLTLVPTPIGHLDDVTVRALAVLRDADVVAAEDTRRSRRLLDHYGITTPLVRLDAHRIPTHGRGVLAAHAHVAFVTDAGTPGISDPGADLLRLALALGVHVEALPGPTALIPALVLSGLPVHRFAFEGFLPRKGRERRERLAEIAARRTTTVLYEAPPRLLATLGDLSAAAGGDRPAAVARELTKRFEEVRRGTLDDLVLAFAERPPRGELVVVVGPAGPGEATDAAASAPPTGEEAEDLARALAAQGAWGRDLRAALMAQGVVRDAAYALATRFGRRPSS
ncbi:MAG: 16S rRNA (cytidine(1402)-2'-O)-methyltransferase [Trueperaceae bacterium]|nr:16S rRNA (cytidine(1402)-2'-O)-methyltransferase [Trueperaceae bacterium]